MIWRVFWKVFLELRGLLLAILDHIGTGRSPQMGAWVPCRRRFVYHETASLRMSLCKRKSCSSRAIEEENICQPLTAQELGHLRRSKRPISVIRPPTDRASELEAMRLTVNLMKYKGGTHLAILIQIRDINTCFGQVAANNATCLVTPDQPSYTGLPSEIGEIGSNVPRCSTSTHPYTLVTTNNIKRNKSICEHGARVSIHQR
jgi:hypothetical protein